MLAIARELGVPDIPRGHPRGLIEAAPLMVSVYRISLTIPRGHPRGLIEADRKPGGCVRLALAFRGDIPAASLKPWPIPRTDEPM